MASTFTKEASLIGLAAAIGVGAIGAYQLFTREGGQESVRSDGMGSKGVGQKVEGTSQLPEHRPSAPLESKDAVKPKSPEPIEVARERERELEAKLAEANQRIAQMTESPGATSTTQKNAPFQPSSSPVIRNEDEARLAADELKKKQKAAVTEFNLQASKFLEEKSDQLWPTKGVETWRACVRLQSQHLSPDDSGRVLELCNLILLDGIRYIRDAGGKVDLLAIASVAKALKREKTLLSPTQVKEIDRLTSQVKKG